ncbi:MAG: site-2 protease family protein [Patescibacteria group bacterium]
MTVILFLVVLAILIFVHELGHFLVAKACGIRVDAFAVGFGPKLVSKTVGEVTYSINLVPFGGYVRIFGENPDDESINGPDSSRSFINKPKWQQVSVLFAGIFFNFVFAWLLIVIAFSSGVPASVSSYPEYRDQMKNERIVVTFVNKGSPAEKAGLKAGDALVTTSVEDFQNVINQSEGKDIEVIYRRNDIESKANIVAEKGIIEGKYAIGIAMDDVATLRLPVHVSVLESVKLTTYMIGATFTGLYDLAAGVFKGTSSLESVTGPIGIAGLIGDAAKLGFTYLIMFTAIISINLGVLNLMPFPALDGGRILFVIIEATIRRPIRPVIANSLNAAGFSLLILLMIVITYRDIAKLFVK